MPHVITQSCCNDASCVSVCPVNCIHPTPEEPGFATAEMLYIDPARCIDCGACTDECPVDAIVPDDLLTPTTSRYLEINAAYYTDHSPTAERRPFQIATPTPSTGHRTVAIVGSGPAGFYCAQELTRHPLVSVSMFDKLPTPYGLIRAGVAPDHPSTKNIDRTFAAVAAKTNFRYFLNVEVGKHVSHQELLNNYDAVVYASGASIDNRLGIAGEDLTGSASATEFVAWYNGHPDHADRAFDLSTKTAVIVGNGNVALDVARILVTDPDALAATDIADHALAALRQSRIQNVIVLGRRGIAQAAYTNSEFLALAELSGVDIVIDPAELALDPATAVAESADTLDSTIAMKIRLARELAGRQPEQSSSGKQIVFRYLCSPTEILGGNHVQRMRCARSTFGESGEVVGTVAQFDLDTGLVLRAVGYRGQPIPGLPFDEATGVVPNSAGRVIVQRHVLPRVYVAGWIKRGATGGIGMNRRCGQETAEAILTDFASRPPRRDLHPPDATNNLIDARGGKPIYRVGWENIDAVERAAGLERGRRRVKLVRIDELEAATRATT